MKATVNVICYKSKKLANGEYPLMLRVSKDGKKKYKSLGISVKLRHWDFDKNRPTVIIGTLKAVCAFQKFNLFIK